MNSKISKQNLVTLVFGAVLLAPLAVVVAGCGAKDPVSTIEATPNGTAPIATTTIASPTTLPGEKLLTAKQASAFSRVAIANKQSKGADFEVVVPGKGGYKVSGVLDWEGNNGSGDITYVDSKMKPSKISWTKDNVTLRDDVVVAYLRGKGEGYVETPLSNANLPLAKIAMLINSVSSSTSENPLLLQQNPEVRFSSETKVDGKKVDKIRFGPTYFYIDEAGFLARVESPFANIEGFVQFTFKNRGPKTAIQIERQLIASPEAVEKAHKALSSTMSN